MKGIVTSASPPELTAFGDTVARPISMKPSGMTLAVDDVVWFEMDSRKVLVVARLVAA